MRNFFDFIEASRNVTIKPPRTIDLSNWHEPCINAPKCFLVKKWFSRFVPQGVKTSYFSFKDYLESLKYTSCFNRPINRIVAQGVKTTYYHFKYKLESLKYTSCFNRPINRIVAQGVKTTYYHFKYKLVSLKYTSCFNRPINHIVPILIKTSLTINGCDVEWHPQDFEGLPELLQLPEVQDWVNYLPEVQDWVNNLPDEQNGENYLPEVEAQHAVIVVARD